MTRDVNAHGELEPTRPLTEKQLQVLRYRAKGLSNDEAATVIGTRPGAVTDRITLAFRKLGVETIIDAFRVIGWLRPPPETDEGLFAHGLGRRTLPWWDVP